MRTFENIIVETNGTVGVITLNRPKMLNALSFGVFREIAAAVDDLEADDNIGCILLTGSEKAFAAGADITSVMAVLQHWGTQIAVRADRTDITSPKDLDGKVYGGFGGPGGAKTCRSRGPR